MVGAPQCPECPVHIHLPLSTGSRLCHSGICIILPIPCQPPLAKANCAFNPLLFLSPPCPGNPLVVLIVCGKQGQSGVGGRGSDERRALLTPAGLHPPTLLLVNRPLFRHLITPGKPPHHPAIIPRGDPDHFARPNGRHSLWVFKAQLLTSGWRAARWGTQRDRGPSTWLGSSMARSSTCSTMATAGLVDGSNPRSWLQMAAGQESRPSLPPIAIGHHRTFFTHLCFCNRRSVAQKQRFWGENKHIDGLQQTINGMAKLQWALTGVKPPVAVGFFRPFTFAAVFLNSTVPICGIAHRGQELIKYHNSKGHHGQGDQKWQHKVILKSEIPLLGLMQDLAHF